MSVIKSAIVSVISAILSLNLFLIIAIMYKDIDVMEFETLMILLYSAQALLVIAIGFALFSILLKCIPGKNRYIRNSMATFMAIVVVTFIGLFGYGYMTFYDGYEPFEPEFYDEISTEQKEYSQKLYSCFELDKEAKSNCTVEYFHFPGTDKIIIDTKDWNSERGFIEYNAEYVRSLSPLMNLILKTSSEHYSDGVKQKINVAGERVTLYKSERCLVGEIKKLNSAFYTKMESNLETITDEDFAKIVLEQYNIINESKRNGFKEFEYEE